VGGLGALFGGAKPPVAMGQVIAKFVDTICIFFYTHSPQFCLIALNVITSAPGSGVARGQRAQGGTLGGPALR